ncbi:MAG: type II toxin-antitoxin system HicA family toxin [Candidatus Ranarchaeia archaeon]
MLRQRGSHVTLSKTKDSETHKITVPFHKELAKGTLNDIISKVALWNGISKDQLLEKI